MLRIHNSLTGEKDPFEPIHPPRVGMYVCGVTVYDYCHVGHARCYLAFDVIQRWLRYRGFDVTYVRNITDIDDKIIRRAAESGEPYTQLTARFIDAMHEDFRALGLQAPNHEPRATQFIPAMVEMIGRLIERGFAYVGGEGDVLYAVARFASYGRLSGKRLEDLRSGARVEIDETKRDPVDFVLWKRAKPGEPAWPSPWGVGRPGWHIECSAMAQELLGTHFDLHGGGEDLKFPHHENEIAQSCAANAGPFVNVWAHNGFVNIDNEKMSKSLGNFFTVRELLPYLRHPEVLRAFLLMSHYRGPINYTASQLLQADAALTRLYGATRGLPSIEPPSSVSEHAPARAATMPGAYRASFEAALDDDFNTPEALAVLHGLARELNAARAQLPDQSAEVGGLARELRALASLLGLLQVPAEQWFKLSPSRSFSAAEVSTDQLAGASGLDEARIAVLIEARLAARAARDFRTADRIRSELREAGVELEDQPGGRHQLEARLKEPRLSMLAAEQTPSTSAVRRPGGAALRVRLIGKSNGVGLTRDLELLAGALRAAGCEVSVYPCERRERRRRRALRVWIAARIRQWRRRRGQDASRADWDLNIMLEHVWPQFLHQARLNVLVPNPEWFDRRDRTFLRAVDRIWTKSAVAEQVFRAEGCATVHIGFDSEDRYLPQLERQRAFLHLAGRSPLKGTRRLLALWRGHPEWPRLTVIENDAMPDKSAAVARGGNVDYQRGYMSDEELRRAQNAHRFHLCPSEAEGWGHYIAEAMSVGAITITTDAPPMNELITPERGLLLASHVSGPHNLAQLARFDAGMLEQAVVRCLSLEPDRLDALGAAARAWFLANKGSFHGRVAHAIAEAHAQVERGSL